MTSSPDSPHAAPRYSPLFIDSTSRFTRRQLHLLRNFSTRTPLRVVAHIDLDAFYAQCEMVRLNTPRDQPLAVQQWDSLIAVNYAARAFNITRMISATEAKKRCPQLITQHVAVFREGEDGKWAYREEGDHNVQTDKVSLDPYRAESRKILDVIKAALLAWAEKIDQRGCGEGKGSVQELAHMLRVEKAGIDEVFIDLSALVYGTLVERYPILQDADPSADVNAYLPRPPTTVLDWHAEDELVDLDEGETEEDDPDWDDVAMLAGADIVRAVRLAVWERLRYTCSGGIARNKMVAKLGSACNKPNKQTIVRNRAVQQFLSGFKFTKIRMLGGKLGQQISSTFGTEELTELLKVPLVQLKSKLGDETGTWLYELIRGNENSEVNPRTQIKSMLSAKSFRPYINSAEQAEKWLRIFVADIYGRLVEDGVLEHKRRPKVITLHYRQNGQSKSRQVPIPVAKAIDEISLYDLAKSLLAQVLAEGNIWPCSNLSLTVSGFEDGVTGNQTLKHFFSRKDDMRKNGPKNNDDDDGILHPTKKMRLEGDEGSKWPMKNGPHDLPARHDPSPNYEISENGFPTARVHGAQEASFPADFVLTFVCPRCNKQVPELERDEHQDWHFAKDLDMEQRRFTDSAIRRLSSKKKRQTRLAFG
ncbi:hypothetical protein VTO42DRAFT_4018 [Malbranchea cinnamomea]